MLPPLRWKTWLTQTQTVTSRILILLYIRYRLTDSQTKMTIFDETIIASYTATFSDAFLGTDRLKMANEGSGKENIKGLIEKLETLKIKPL